MTDDLSIIKEYKEAFRKYAKDGIIDLDNRLKHKFDYQIHRLETVIKELKGEVPPIRQSQYFITLVKTGSGRKSIGNFEFPIKKNTLLLIPKRVMHSSSYWSTRCSGFVLSFNIDFFLQNAFPRKHISGRKIFKTSLKPYLTLSNQEVTQLAAIFEFIAKEHRDGRNPKNEMIAVKILELMIQCDRLYTSAPSPDKKPVYDGSFERFNELVDKYFTEHRSVTFYADAIKVHPYHLNFLSKQLTGLSAKEAINNRVMQEAKYLLTSSALTIKEIAYRLGFDDPDYFCVFFRKKVQKTPSEYRGEFC
ncbi:MAG TPA: helix-turn-helix transcriptional regulator [Cyclobacteriaceae bacterium]|nr:helix-turn-helix transcriptional regulator [Cyclobacteriaceae bacterium]